MVTRHNPALRQESLSQPARIIPPRDMESLFTWIEGTGRFQSNEFDESHDHKVAEELEDIMDSNNYEDKDEPEDEEM
jgi:Protein of unknown function (DUF3134)